MIKKNTKWIFGGICWSGRDLPEFADRRLRGCWLFPSAGAAVPAGGACYYARLAAVTLAVPSTPAAAVSVQLMLQCLLRLVAAVALANCWSELAVLDLPSAGCAGWRTNGEERERGGCLREGEDE
ncbi:hypothetical protein KY289_030670 [Solanum tuberosum]|nr:hypothetical protein KY289_030670 [Solanum tuberosum]